MRKLYEELFFALKEHDKENAVKLAMNALESRVVDVITLYEDMLTPILNNVIEEFEDEDMLIWEEHVRSEIVLCIIENAYLYILKEREQRGVNREEEVIVLCPKFEDHIIGAKMAADIFTIAGYETIFIGSNTPWNTVIKAIEVIKPKIVCISVTNFYNIVETRNTIDNIKKNFNYDIRFILSGYAFRNSDNLYKEIGGDIYIKNLKDIFLLEEEVNRK